MLETEEVDDDFFTPVASTSLASIFGNASRNKDGNDNDSLKYVPPKPQNIMPKKKESSKATECVFACALIGHEWCNNVYTSRGKLGFAIVKVQKTGQHNVILYDSNKTTLSSVTISSKLKITIKNNTYISYYDSLQKYWSIYGTEDETAKITKLLNDMGAHINYSAYVEKGPLEPNNKAEVDTHDTLEESVQPPRESDTDSSLNRKTKASILDRMANMGHSVLPTRVLPVEKTSDSDTDDVEAHPKAIRPKIIKPLKRHNVENIISATQQVNDAHQRLILSKPEPDTNVTMYNSQLLPLTNTSILTSNEFGMFMSEQRIGNSELRININRITDKVDSVLDKINSLEHKDNTNVSNDILQKLLNEYEHKIRIYEELLKSRGIDDKKIITSQFKYSNEDVEVLNNKLSEIKIINEQKCDEISNLKEEIRCLKEKQSQESQSQANKEKELITKVNNLENMLETKNKELTNMVMNATTNTDHSDDNIEDKVKNIMNDTFQTISMNFEDSNVYSGETIKRTIGTVIKKITIHTLNELKQN